MPNSPDALRVPPRPGFSPNLYRRYVGDLYRLPLSFRRSVTRLFTFATTVLAVGFCGPAWAVDTVSEGPFFTESAPVGAKRSSAVAKPVVPASKEIRQGGRPGLLKTLVFLEESNRPLGRIKVVVRENAAKTNEDGAARFPLPSDTYEVRIAVANERLGLDSGAETVFSVPNLPVLPGETTEAIITLARDGSVKNVLLEHAPTEGGSSSADELARLRKERPPGVVKGRLISLEKQKPVSRAQIFVMGLPLDAQSNNMGRFQMELPSGQHTLSVIHSAYSNQTVQVDVPANGEVEIKVELTPAAQELEAFVVVAPHIEGGLASVLDERRDTDQLTEVLGAEQMSKAGDSSAASALQRVTGVTLVDGKFIYIRGLGERYSTTLLNGLELPSPDPTRRVIPLNLFPTGVLGSILVQKTFSADMPAEFSGGIVSLRTKGIPEGFEASVSLSTGGNTQGTFQKNFDHSGGGRDFLGVDNNNWRNQSDSFIAELMAAEAAGGGSFNGASLAQRGTLASLLNNDRFDVDKRTLPPNFGLQMQVGDRHEKGDLEWGYRAAGLYSNGWEVVEEERRIAQGPDDFINDTDLFRSAYKVGLAGLVTAGVGMEDKFHLDWTSFISRASSRRTDRWLTLNSDQGTETLEENTRMLWIEQEILSHQLVGKGHLPFGIELDGRVAFSKAKRTQPDAITYLYREGQTFDPVAMTQTSVFRFDPQAGVNRSFEDLDDDSLAYGLDLTVPYALTDDMSLKLKTGFQAFSVDRVAPAPRFQHGVFPPPDLRPRKPLGRNHVHPD